MEDNKNSTIHQIEDVVLHFFEVLNKIVNGELSPSLIHPLFLEFHYHYGDLIEKDKRLFRIFNYANSLIQEPHFERRELERIISNLKKQL